MRILLLTLCVTMASCSCNWHIKRVKAKCGLTSDTITVHDTIVIPKTHYDTAFSIREIWHDTLMIVKGKDTYHFFYDTNKRELNFDHKRDTIHVPYEKTIIKNNYHESIGKWYWFLIILIGLIFVILLRRR